MINSLTGLIGRQTITYTAHLLNLLAFGVKLFSTMANAPLRGRAVVKWGIVEQIYFTAVQALFLIVPLSLLLGCMILMQFARFSAQIDLGKIVVILIIREVGPVITAMLVILRSATAVTIEISYMNVLNEIESLEMAGIDPMRLLAIPRFVGITSAILCLFIIFDVGAILGGYGIIRLTTSIPMGNYLPDIAKAIAGADIVIGLVKALLFGVVISVVTLYHGFESQKRITNIPRVTSKVAIECFFYCILINIFVSGLFYF
ncbi:MAG: ABC transporter permease [Thermodesulfobacteriota bacterium]|nr:ABC transporter permease [Thermodesulfobacteriota bacterium]